MPRTERRTACRVCGAWIRSQFIVYHLKMNHPDPKAAADPTFQRKRAAARQTATCPVCQGRISAHLLDWHLRRWHDNPDDRPMALA